MSSALMTHIVYSKAPSGDSAQSAGRSRETSTDRSLDELIAEAVQLLGGGLAARSLHLLFAPSQRQFAELSISFGKVQGLDQCVQIQFPFCDVPDVLAKLVAAGRSDAFGMVSVPLYRVSGGGRKKRTRTKAPAEQPAPSLVL